MSTTDPVRETIARVLDWGDAHATLEQAVRGLSFDLQGRAPESLPYSPWQLLEHIRITQRDILDFCRDPAYQEPKWPDDYWPETAAPPSRAAWDESVAACRSDCQELKAMATDSTVDLVGRIPVGHGQTYLREYLLVVDHTAYHLGQLVAVRRALGAWPPGLMVGSSPG